MEFLRYGDQNAVIRTTINGNSAVEGFVLASQLNVAHSSTVDTVSRLAKQSGEKMVKQLVKRAFGAVGLKVEKRDCLAESIPASYLRSDYLPSIYRQSVQRLFYFKDMQERVADIEGDIVECGVSIGSGLLYFALIEYLNERERKIWGFDSFEGFPDPTAEDLMTDGTQHVSRGVYSTSEALVQRILADSRMPTDYIQRCVRLEKGFFEDSLPRYTGKIALLHLDCDLYKSYITALEMLYDKVVPGGIILFDEYEEGKFPGARKAIDEFFYAKSEVIEQFSGYRYDKYFTVKKK